MKATTKYIQLLDYLEFRGTRSWRELLGKHRMTSGPVTKGLTVGRWDPQSKTWKDGVTDYRVSVIEYCFPRQTLARLLKKGVNEGLIQKIPEPKEKGKRGRQAYLYGLAPGVVRTYPAIHCKIPVGSSHGMDAYFFGFMKCRNKKNFLQLYPHFKQMKDALCLTNPVFAKAVKEDQLNRKCGLGRKRKDRRKLKVI